MRRLTISIDDDLAETFDRFVAEKGYENRSEAFRDLVRNEVGKEQLQENAATHCVATLSYVYNHHERQLPSRLTSMQHDHHDLAVATMHAHLDHDDCIETVILRGRTSQVVHFAQDVIAETGVRHGRFYPIPVEIDTKAAKRGRRHVHTHPHN